MKVTDEMVEAACLTMYEHCDVAGHMNEMRAAIEAALGQFVLQYGDNIELQEAEQIGFKRSSACIEDLAAVLKSCESWIDRWTSHVGHCDGVVKCTCGRAAMLYEASATLEKWGLK